MTYWHMQMQMPHNRESNLRIDSKKVLEEDKVLGTGDWDDIQCDYFKGKADRPMKVGDIVLVRKGKTPVALCKVKSDVFKDPQLTKKYHHQLFRKVEVLCFYDGEEKFPVSQGTLGSLVDSNTPSYKFIEKLRAECEKKNS